jgi:hypothetical protein
MVLGMNAISFWMRDNVITEEEMKIHMGIHVYGFLMLIILKEELARINQKDILTLIFVLYSKMKNNVWG